MTYTIKPIMDPRTIFDYKCHTCKKTKSPDNYRSFHGLELFRVTCNACNLKRACRENALRIRRFNELLLLYEASQTPRLIINIAPDTTEEGEPMIINLPTDTTTEEHVFPSCGPANYYVGEPEPEPVPELTPEPE